MAPGAGRGFGVDCGTVLKLEFLRSDFLRRKGMASESGTTTAAAASSAESGSARAARQPVAGVELNAWRRGFTPQAEIWNGRLAMLGLSVGLATLLLVRLFGGSPS